MRQAAAATEFQLIKLHTSCECMKTGCGWRCRAQRNQRFEKKGCTYRDRDTIGTKLKNEEGSRMNEDTSFPAAMVVEMGSDTLVYC